MHLGLGECHGEARNVSALIQPHPDGGKQRYIAHNAVMAGLFLACIQNEVFHRVEGTVAPCGQFAVQQLGGPAHPGR